MKKLSVFLGYIDRISEWTGKWIAGLVVVLAFVLAFEVTARYAFDKPTLWAFDIGYMLGGTFFMIGAAYTHLYKGHVRIDIIYNSLSPRKRALIDLIFTGAIFFPLWIAILWKLIPYVYFSWQIGERSLESFWRPPIYHFKTVMPVAIFLLLLQGVAEFIRDLVFVITGKRP